MHYYHTGKKTGAASSQLFQQSTGFFFLINLVYKM